MKSRWETIHKVVDFLIPYTLILLIIILVINFGFPDLYNRYSLAFEIADIFIIIVFLFDLIFKYHRAKSIPGFLKDSWIDIIAVFPFFLVFRVVEAVGLVRGLEAGKEAQQFFHASVELEKELKGVTQIEKEVKLASQLEKEAKLAKEAQLIVEETARSEKFARFLRPILRSPRLVANGAEFYEEPENKKAIDSEVNKLEVEVNQEVQKVKTGIKQEVRKARKEVKKIERKMRKV